MKSTDCYSLPVISYLSFRFKLKAEQEASLPSFKGSLLRGVFGSTLRRTVCVMESGYDCHKCLLNRKCVYTQLFETIVFDNPSRFLRGVINSPKPFILDCPDEKSKFRIGDTLEFELKLIGTANEYYPFVIYSVKHLAERGLGGKRAKFKLEQAEYCGADGSWIEIFDGNTQQLSKTPQPLVTNNRIVSSIKNLSIEFVTPTRIKHKGHFVTDFNFRTLTFIMLRRILELAHFYMPGADINWEFHDLLVAANNVEITDKKLHWIDLTRYSARQKTEMELGGFVGWIELEGALAPFLPIIKMAEVLNVGKGTTFGLGKVHVKEGV